MMYGCSSFQKWHEINKICQKLPTSPSLSCLLLILLIYLILTGLLRDMDQYLIRVGKDSLSTVFGMAFSDNVIEVDGSILEGGGQILRMAVVFSTLLRKNIRIVKIRAGRDKPGLKPQHLMGLNLVRDLCKGKLVGATAGSTEITFYPNQLNGGDYVADTKTAGSVALLMQVSIPTAIFSNGVARLTLRGGTNAEMAPQIDYTTQVFRPIAERFGVKFDCDVIRRGYYPKGGGEVVVRTYPTQSLNQVELLDRGDLVKITGRSWVAGVLPIKVADTMARSATDLLRRHFGNVYVELESIKEPENAAIGTGAGIILVVHTSTGCLLGSDSLGKRGIPAEEVGASAAKSLIENWNSGACVDEWLQDQLIVFMALSPGISQIRTGPLTLHTKTVIYIAEQLSDAKFFVKDAAGGSKIIESQGISLQNRHNID